VDNVFFSEWKEKGGEEEEREMKNILLYTQHKLLWSDDEATTPIVISM
jgi:hypothetical protein